MLVSHRIYRWDSCLIYACNLLCPSKMNGCPFYFQFCFLLNLNHLTAPWYECALSASSTSSWGNPLGVNAVRSAGGISLKEGEDGGANSLHSRERYSSLSHLFQGHRKLTGFHYLVPVALLPLSRERDELLYGTSLSLWVLRCLLSRNRWFFGSWCTFPGFPSWILNNSAWGLRQKLQLQKFSRHTPV